MNAEVLERLKYHIAEALKAMSELGEVTPETDLSFVLAMRYLTKARIELNRFMAKGGDQ